MSVSKEDAYTACKIGRLTRDEPNDAEVQHMRRQLEWFAAHLSAQAKVQVTKEMAQEMWVLFQRSGGRVGGPLAMQAVLETFAARLSQDAQGEVVAWLDPDTQDAITDQRKKDWESNFGAGGVKKASAYTMRLYAHPAERAAVPDGWVSAARRALAEYRKLRPKVVFDRGAFDGLEAMLTAAPQPAGEARVDTDG